MSKEYCEKGDKCYENGDYDGAITNYVEALQTNRNCALAWYKLGNAWLKKGDIDESIVCYTEAILLETNDTVVLYNRGILWKQKEEFDKAIADFDAVLRLNPKNQDAIDNRDVTLYLKSRKRQAEKNQIFSNPAQFNEEAITQQKLENCVNELIKQSIEKGYIPKVLISMVNRYGTMKAIKMLVNSKEIQSGIRRLQEIGLLHLSVETAVLKFPKKFTSEEQESARWRLEQLGYDFGSREDIETTQPVSKSSEEITDENEGEQWSGEDMPLPSQEQQGEAILVSSSSDEREKSCEECIKIMAHESLDIFSKIANDAQSEIDDTPTRSRFSPLAAPNAKAIKNLGRGRQENLENYRKLVRNPTNTRVVTKNKKEEKEIYYVSQATPPSSKYADNIWVVSYHAPIGRLASLPVGEKDWLEIPNGKEKFFEVIEKAEFHPLKDAEGWDSKNTAFASEACNQITIESLREFLRDPDKKLFIKGKRRGIRDKMELPDQFILDQYQDELFRLPLDSRILLLGAPGTGKTTTLIRRLSQKLDVEHLNEDENRIAGIKDSITESNHSESWVMFTPTEFLKLYVKESFNREGVPAPDEHINTWDEFRIDLARNQFGVLRSVSGSRSYVMKNSFLTLKAGSKTNLIEWFKDFDRWQKTIFLEEMRSHAKKISSEQSSSEISMLGKNILTILGTDDEELQPSVFMSLLKVTEQIQKIVKNIKESSDKEIRRALNIQIHKDNHFLDNFASFIEGLPEEMSNSDEQDTSIDDDEEEEQSQSSVGRAGAEAHFMQAVRSQARLRARNRNVSKSSRTGRLIEWLGDRTLPDEELKEIGKDLALQSVLRQFINPVPRYINRIPIRYRRFRKERQAENLWYCTGGFSPADIHPLEVDIILLAMIRGANGLIASFPELNNSDNPAYKTLGKMQNLYRTQVLVDEVSDFSPIQLSCMMNISRPGVRSFFACGDFHQRITSWGTDSIEQMKWAVPNIVDKKVSILYRQSRKLHDFSKAIIRVSGNHIDDAELPEYENNEGVPPVLAIHTSEISEIANWLSERIQEIEQIEGELPSIAVLVNSKKEIQSIAKALEDALTDQNISVIPCLNGQFHGQDNAVRVFNVEYIKGLEFEAVFFVGIDKLAENQPDLFDKYLYVGATRAATYLGITCEQDLPHMMDGLRRLFTQYWTDKKKQEDRTFETKENTLPEAKEIQREPVSSNLPTDEKQECQTDNQEKKITDNNLLSWRFWHSLTLVENSANGINLRAVILAVLLGGFVGWLLIKIFS